ncbi:MAG TPA: tetratricopeptide repeat protein [Myxococcales bacterium]|nr:tetratricopeptide repeat protein [Myxococcales bacterium]
MMRWLFVVLGCSAMLAIPVSALAQTTPKRMETPGKKRASRDKETSGKLKSGGFDLKNFEQTMFNSEQKAVLEKIFGQRKTIIQKLETLLRNRPLYPRKAEVYFRLGEEHWEVAKYQFLKAVGKFDAELTAFDNGTLTIKPQHPIQDYSSALSYYRKVIQQFPDYARIDEVMYYLGRGALEQGKENKDRALVKEGVTYFQKLVQNYPRSKFIAESHLALGEHFFDTDSLYYAKTNYEKIINNFPKSPMYNYALYKLGWVYFNLREFRRTVETFQNVVKKVSARAGQVSFREQALNDLVKTWAEMDDSWREALSYFKTVTKDEKAIYKRMEKLADLYVGYDKDKEAVELVNHFIERTPLDRKVISWLELLLDVRRKVNDFGKVEDEIRRILGYFQPDGRYFSAHKTNSDIIDEATRLAETNLLWLANHWHVEAEKAEKYKKRKVADELYAKAAADYKIFLARFPQSKHSYLIRFYYAEINYIKTHNYEIALEQYQKVINEDKKGKFIEDAALGVIYSSYEIMVKKGLRKKGSRGKVTVKKLSEKEIRKREHKKIERSELHSLEKSYVAAADQYVDLLLGLRKDAEWKRKNPKRGAQIPEIMYMAAETFYRHGQFRDAVKRLNKIFEFDANHKYAAVAVVTLVQAYARLRRWEKVELWARALIKKRNFKYKSKKELGRYIAIAISENAGDLSKMQKHDEAIKESMRLVKEFRGSKELASKALMNVAVMYERAKRIKDAVRTYERVVRDYKSQGVASEAQFIIGLIYENQTRFEEAADAFMKMGKFKKKKQAPDAIRYAALIREAQKDYKGSIKAFQKWLKLWPKKDLAATVFFRIGLLYERIGDKRALKSAIKHYQKFAKKFPERYVMKVEAYARAADIMRKMDKADDKKSEAKWIAKKRKTPYRPRMRNRKKISALFEKGLAEFPKAMNQVMTLRGKDKIAKHATAKNYAAQASYWLADYVFHDFDNAKIPGTLKPKILKKGLVDKAELHQTAEKAFDKVLTFKSADWIACAAFRSGLLYYNFAEELFQVPIPFGLTPEQEDEYRAILEEMGAPIQEKALILLKAAIDVAHLKGVYNQCSKEAGAYAMKVNPEAFPIANEDQVKPNHTNDTLLSANFIRTLRRGNTAVDMLKKTTKDTDK